MNQLEGLLERVKTAAFLGNNAAFLGSILCQLDGVIWDTSIATAATNGKVLKWNPDWFLSLPEDTRKAVLLHELWHVGRLHLLRGIDKDPEYWNSACDYVINQGLADDGYTFTGTTPLLDSQYKGMSEEDIYELLLQNSESIPQSDMANDIEVITPEEAQQVISKVTMAVQQAKVAKQVGNLPGEIEQTLDKFLDPLLPWQQLLFRFMSELRDADYSWTKRNRRYPDVYMPGIVKEESGLEHLAYFLDVSGSVSDHEILRFNSEVKYIKEELEPEKLTLILFDTRIQSVIVFEKDDLFDSVVVTGRGGTSLEPVKEWIDLHEPTAAIIFSDMQCYPMSQLKRPIPVMWIVTGKGGHTPAFGDVIRI